MSDNPARQAAEAARQDQQAAYDLRDDLQQRVNRAASAYAPVAVQHAQGHGWHYFGWALVAFLLGIWWWPRHARRARA
ncbi:MAG: hypothetical protein ABIO70_30360 [Pseudomonadota bacterium]